MKVIAFNGSPRPHGNTGTLLRRCLEIIENEGLETEFIQVGGSGIKPCRGCDACRTIHPERCAIIDDQLNAWFEKMCQAKAILLGSPTYLWGITPEMKCLMDRAGYLTRGKLSKGQVDGLFRRKIGAAISCDAVTGAVQAVQAMQTFFFATQMIVPGVSYWPIAKGARPGDVVDDKKGMAHIEELGRTIAWLAKRL